MKPSSEYCKHLLKMAELYRDEQAARASGVQLDVSPLRPVTLIHRPGNRKPFAPPSDLLEFFTLSGLTDEGMTHILDVTHPLRVYIDDCIANPESVQHPQPPEPVQDDSATQTSTGDAQG